MQGAGLSLYLCRKLCSESNGSIHVESAPGQGSRFVFSLDVTVQANTVEQKILQSCKNSNAPSPPPGQLINSNSQIKYTSNLP
mmetsp:Transcript_19794/g.26751  ORF Transcript_19794/g.26751 Transcript_19794/m.26751 type:complete len:83 (-) Transcript_19794:175-423(-)